MVIFDRVCALNEGANMAPPQSTQREPNWGEFSQDHDEVLIAWLGLLRERSALSTPSGYLFSVSENA